MIAALVVFELKRRLQLLSSFVYAAILAGAGGFLMAANAGLFRGLSTSTGNERVFANGPFTVFANANVAALLGLFTVAAIFGQAAFEDFGTNTWPLIFSRNVNRARYLLGRFLGAYVFSAILFLSIGAGMALVAVVGRLVDPSQLGPHRLEAYLWPYLLGIWPMLFVAGAVFFTLATLTRAMAPVYVGMVVLVLGYLVLNSALHDVENLTAAGLLDPFGFITFDAVTRYWTPEERNQSLIPLFGLFGLNRALWLIAASATLLVTALRFDPKVESQGTPRDERSGLPTGAFVTVAPAPSSAGWRATLLWNAWRDFLEIVRSPVFWSLMAAGLAFTIIGIVVSPQLFGTQTYPVTSRVLELTHGTFRPFVIIALTLYAGELVWKEREAQFADVVDATRAPSWVSFGSKLVTLVLLTAALQAVSGVSALTVQLGSGFFSIEPKLYATELIGFGFLHDVLLAVLALSVQVMIGHKYLGHGAMVLFFVLGAALRMLGVEDRLAQFGAEPQIPYSDLNGYGHWVGAVLVYRAFWYAVGAVLLIAAFSFFPRGRSRRRRSLSRPLRLAVTVMTVVAVGLGSFIVLETRVRHRFGSKKDQETVRAQYELRFGSFRSLPTPRIVDVDLTAELHPERPVPSASFSGRYLLENASSSPIASVLVTLSEEATEVSLAIGNARAPVHVDDALGVRTFTLDPPLAPGERRTLTFSATFDSAPLVNTRLTEVVGNGTFLTSYRLPLIGYQPMLELSEDGDRRQYGLAPKARMADRDDPRGLQHNYLRPDADFIRFRATVSTSADQRALAPGTLIKEWKEGDRRFFRYELSQPAAPFFAVLSARYAVTTLDWHGVSLEVYADPKHGWNVGRMLTAMKETLSYCTQAFGPYQHDALRIVEFPRYQTFAQSFPGLIPYSESVGFLARVRDERPDEIDSPSYVTAHEVAHQWWAHQVLGGDVQGATMTSETLAQYTALMVMKQRYGAPAMRRFLKYELDRYLLGRVTERKQELPLSRVENQQYVHYQKGTLAMFWLQDVIGEATVNRALKKYVEAARFRGPPYTNSVELLTFLRAETPPEHHPLIDDLFERIVLYDNRTERAAMTQRADGGFEVTFSARTVKYVSDDAGVQTEAPMDDLIEVGALDEHGTALFLEKRRFPAGLTVVQFTVPSAPATVGIDPLNKLIDRTSADNVMAPERR